VLVSLGKRLFFQEQPATIQEMRALSPLLAISLLALASVTGLCGCEKRTGYATVVGKDYVAATKEGEEVNDERATNHDQWIVKVRMLDDGRRIEVRADKAQWEKLQQDDRVKVNYRVGKYSGSVWYSEIE
jgi:hypothetical protein